MFLPRRIDVREHIDQRERESVYAWARAASHSTRWDPEPTYRSTARNRCAPPVGEYLLERFLGIATSLTGHTRIHPVNSFLRIYERGSLLRGHIDREGITWTISWMLALDQQEQWPLQVRAWLGRGEEVEVPMGFGDAVLMAGRHYHSREMLTGEQAIVLLLNYSEIAEDRYDRRDEDAALALREAGALELAAVRDQLDTESPYYIARELLSPPEIEAALESRAALDPAQGLLKGGAMDTAIRDSDVRWLHRAPEHAWLTERIDDVAADAARFRYGVSYTPRHTGAMQFTAYTQGGQYNWHMDASPPSLAAAPERKLSVIVCLSRAEEGGALEFQALGEQPPILDPGDAIVFPSYYVHRIAPVLTGERISLVAWYYGPPWR